MPGIQDKNSNPDNKFSSAKLLLYGYSCYGVSISPSFNSSRFCLVDRDIIFAISHARGSMDLGMHWWNEGKLMQKMNTMKDFISCANYLNLAVYFTGSE